MTELLLLGETLARQLREQERQHFESLAKTAVPWNDNLTFRETLCIKADTFRPDSLFDVEPLRGAQRVLDLDRCIVSPDGRYIYCRRALPRGCGLEIWCGRRRGRVYFDDEVVVPVLAEIVPGERHPQVLMSVTPAEILTLR